MDKIIIQTIGIKKRDIFASFLYSNQSDEMLFHHDHFFC